MVADAEFLALYCLVSLHAYMESIFSVLFSRAFPHGFPYLQKKSLDFMKGGSGIQESIPRQNIDLKSEGEAEVSKTIKGWIRN